MFILHLLNCIHMHSYKIFPFSLYTIKKEKSNSASPYHPSERLVLAGPREQVNQNSAFLDASHVYGEHVCRAVGLRAAAGRLNVTLMPPPGPNAPPRELLPMTNTNPECRAQSGLCFYAGKICQGQKGQ